MDSPKKSNLCAKTTTKNSTKLPYPALPSHKRIVAKLKRSCTSRSRSWAAPAGSATGIPTAPTVSSGTPCSLPRVHTGFAARSPSPEAAEVADEEGPAMRRAKAALATTSLGGPATATRPASSSTTRSKRFNLATCGCVTTIRVRPCSAGPNSNSLKMCCPVDASTEEKGSSKRTSSACSMYAALARATRARWPPDKRMPKEPIVAKSPPGKI
mmetsp:Transcript_30632/g.80600  ORF Transcript_30632/g.80600 Transcript_30632/m.80600 type:complete len:213 (+) Transcript_30632:871-1509(+)